MTLSRDPYKGVRDFYPEDQFIQNYIFNTWRGTVRSYGYEEYNASILEPTELYTAKTSEEIVNEQTYTFTDRGDRSVTLRPEMTPSVSRMIARKRRELTLPLRWFSIGNMFRYERPQKGRLREHWQLNADLFGLTGTHADSEMISLSHAILRAFGAEEEDFTIKINDRGAVRDYLVQNGMSEQKAEEELSRMDKGKASKETIPPPKNIERIITTLTERGLNNIVYDQNIVRGFSYYTGTVFEVFDTSKNNNRSLFGGGRYDSLIEKLGGENIPAVGFAVGDVVMRDFLETHNLLPDYAPATDLCICYADTDKITEVNTVANTLRQQGLNVVTADPAKKVGDQIQFADKLNIPFVLCIGDDELTSGTYNVKHLGSGKETELTQDELAPFIVEHLGPKL